MVDTVGRVKGANPAARYCCDPVIGDVGRGVFVRRGVPELIRERALPIADFVTPNQFELDFLTGRTTATLAEALAAVDAVHALGPRVVLVTSLRLDETPADAIDLVASDGIGRYRLRTPLLPLTINGAGDADRGAVLRAPSAHRLGRRGLVAGGFLAVRRAQPYRRAGSREMLLVEAQQEFVTPRRIFRRGRSRLSFGRVFWQKAPWRRPMRRNFVTLDVFTDRRFAGNPLAVVLDSDGLETAAMQAIAREFNLPETVFVFPPETSGAPRPRSHLHAGARAAVRRPSDGRDRGAARAARRRRRRPRARAGGADRPGALHARGDRRRRMAAPASRSRKLPAEVGTGARRRGDRRRAQLAPADIGFDQFQPSRWSAGNPCTFVPVAGLAAIAALRP